MLFFQLYIINSGCHPHLNLYTYILDVCELVSPNPIPTNSPCNDTSSKTIFYSFCEGKIISLITHLTKSTHWLGLFLKANMSNVIYAVLTVLIGFTTIDIYCFQRTVYILPVNYKFKMPQYQILSNMCESVSGFFTLIGI